MTTTGTTSFSPTIVEIVEEAYERIGKELRTGYDLRSARRSLNLLCLDWANRGLNLWTVEQESVPLLAGTASYTLPTDTVDIIEAVRRQGSGTSQFDLSMSRISVSDYANISVKNSPGPPVQYYVSRVDPPVVTVWPVPIDTTYTLIYWKLRRIQDASTSGGDTTLDIPPRFVPAMVSGLAYQLAIKMAPEKAQLLKMQYDEDFGVASTEDRDRASLFLVPAMQDYNR